jgi:hypothetical protein
MKPLFIISSPFDTYSGYGARSRDLIKSIVKSDKYNVRLMSQRWGNTPFGFCKDNPEWVFLLDLVLPQNQLPKQPEIWAQVSVPNEFQPVGKYNIGFTAGIETTIVPGEFIEGVNRMDITFVSSEHAKKSFVETKFEKHNQKTGHKEVIEVNKPIEVLFEGYNTEIYKHIDKKEYVSTIPEINDIPESFAYLFVGHWMQGDLGEDRKNVGLLIKAFFETFKNKKTQPALILKTSQVGSSYMDRDAILNKIRIIRESVNSSSLPNIYLLHGEFTDIEMNNLYNHPKIKAMVSLTKGEGFGRPLLEFTISKKPLITTAWSGHLDFLNQEFTHLIAGELTNVHPSAANQFLLKEAKWFAPDHSHVGHYLKDVFENYKKYTDGGKRQAHYSKTNFTWELMKDKLNTYLEKNLPEFPKEVTLKLPTLDKIELPKRNK